VWQRAALEEECHNTKIKDQKSDQNLLRRFKRGLALGGTQPLPEIFQAAGIRFDFSADTLQPLGDLVLREIERLQE
jgi:oligoendopeptidase F